MKKYAVSYMESTGSFEYCRTVLSELMEKAKTMVEELDDGSNKGKAVLKILDKLTV